MDLDLHDKSEAPEPEKLVIIFVEGRPEGEPGVWDGSTFVDANGFPQTVTHWAYFPKFRRPEPRRLLIVSCSATKNHCPEKLAALDRYTGAYYSIIKGHKGTRPEIVILSAEHGFISATERIHDYDRRMDAARAAELLPWAGPRLGWLLRQADYDEVFVAAGKEYREVIRPALAKCMGSTFKSIRYARGGIGCQRQQLKQWLNNELT